MAEESYLLLKTFSDLFEGKRYLHRISNLGDLVATHLYEDLLGLGTSSKLVARIERKESVVNLSNAAVGKKARRGDGTFGELVPAAIAVEEHGFRVARGEIASLEIGAETKILAKAMIKQIDRVISDLKRQAEHFRKIGSNPICVAFVGINHAHEYTSFEGKRRFATDGKKNKHPAQEAIQATQRIVSDVSADYDELQILPFKATNRRPFPFEWLNFKQTELEYSALLARVSREYEMRY